MAFLDECISKEWFPGPWENIPGTETWKEALEELHLKGQIIEFLIGRILSKDTKIMKVRHQSQEKSHLNFRFAWGTLRPLVRAEKKKVEEGKKDNMVVMKLCCSDLFSGQPLYWRQLLAESLQLLYLWICPTVHIEVKLSQLFPANDWARQRCGAQATLPNMRFL